MPRPTRLLPLLLAALGASLAAQGTYQWVVPSRSSIVPMGPGVPVQVTTVTAHVKIADRAAVTSLEIELHNPAARAPIGVCHSTSHELDVAAAGASTRRLRVRERCRRDPGSLRLCWTTVGDPQQPTAALFAYPDPSIGGGWFLLLANVLPDECWIEVAGQRVRSGASVRLPYGRHRTDLVGPAVRERSTEIFVAPGAAARRMGLLTQRRGVGDPAFYRAGASPVHCTTGHSWTPMAPGLHHFRAVDGEGREEAQSLVHGEGPGDVQLLPAILADVDGSFRCPWSIVFMPLLPALRLTSKAERWLADAETIEIGGAGTVAAACAYVPGAEGVTTEVELT